MNLSNLLKYFNKYKFSLKKIYLHKYWRSQFVGNKAKGRISKWVFQENKVHQNFPKNEQFWSPDTHTYECVSGGKKCSFIVNLACFVFWENLFWDAHFCLITNEFEFFKCSNYEAEKKLFSFAFCPVKLWYRNHVDHYQGKHIGIRHPYTSAWCPRLRLWSSLSQSFGATFTLI